MNSSVLLKALLKETVRVDCLVNARVSAYRITNRWPSFIIYSSGGSGG